MAHVYIVYSFHTKRWIDDCFVVYTHIGRIAFFKHLHTLSIVFVSWELNVTQTQPHLAYIFVFSYVSSLQALGRSKPIDKDAALERLYHPDHVIPQTFYFWNILMDWVGWVESSKVHVLRGIESKCTTRKLFIPILSVFALNLCI